jgi:2-polyprenyl-3-methyl-5-hydroxy-6-metoxy-1,4-benzoquinol methylase
MDHVATTEAMDRETAAEEMKKYHFLVSLDLGEGLKSPGRPIEEHKRKIIDIIHSMDIAGKRAADLGCANGLFSLEAEKSGAGEIIAIDNTVNNIDCLNKLIIPRMKSKITPLLLNVLDLDPVTHGTFDLIICGGLLYHMRYPFWFLRMVANLLRDGGDLILETAIFEDFDTRPLLFCPTAKDSPYDLAALACAFFNEKALTETVEECRLKILSRHVTTKPLRRFLKKTAGNLWPWYRPISRIVLHCTKNGGSGDDRLDRIYDGILT